MKIECKFRTATMKDIQELKKLFCNTVMTVNRRDYTAEEVADWASCCESDGRWEQLLSTLYFIVATDVEGQMLGFTAHPINSGERKKILSLHHGKFNVRVFGKLYAAIQYIISFYNSKSRK